MSILYFIFLLLASEQLYVVETNRATGLDPYPFGTPVITLFTHTMILITSIWHLGWLWGILFFALSFFGIIHVTIGWVLNIPSLISNIKHKDDTYSLNLVKKKVDSLGIIAIISLIFCIASFFTVNFSASSVYLKQSITLVIISITAIILFILRCIVVKMLGYK